MLRNKREYTEKEFNFLLNIRKQFIETHKKCNGTGIIKDKDIKDCKCFKIFKFIKELVYANIPFDYFFKSVFSFKEVDLTALKYVEDLIENLNNAILKRKGIFFYGENGIFKTSFLAEIGKNAIVNGYKVFYITLKEIIKNQFKQDEKIEKRIEEADLIFVDEIDKVYFTQEKKMFTINEIVSFFKTDKTFCCASNLSDDSIKVYFGKESKSMMSNFNRKMKFVPVEGDDYSNKVQDNWEKIIKEKVHYFSRSIVKYSEMFNELKKEV